MPMHSPDEPVNLSGLLVSNGKRTMTLDELAQHQPGLDSLMTQIADRAWRLYHAAQAENWPLAAYFSRTLIKHLRRAAFLRPKYDEAIREFVETDHAAVRAAIEASDAAAFATAWTQMEQRVNHWHEVYGKGYLVWQTPPTPPADLDLRPRPA
ncbi:MAG: hypothetical protein ABR520_00150 [Mycobacteriales bacterium]|nr:hypothetical protein [Frankia sp.]